MEGKAYASLSGLVSDGALSHLPKKYGFELYGYDSDVGLVDISRIEMLQDRVLLPEHPESLDGLSHCQPQRKLQLWESHGGYRLVIWLLHHRQERMVYSLLTCWE